jgi:predicted GNAT family N-acyltransferase
MKTQTSNAAIPVLLSTVTTKTFTLREITDAAELENAFRLRYEVYSNSSNQVFLKQNSHKVDINIFDLHSKHYGLFAENNELAGYLRVVLGRNELYNSEVFEIGKKLEIFTESEHSFENIKKIATADFPFLSFPTVPDSIKSCYNTLKSKKEGFVEAGRIAVSEKYRGARISTFLIECAVVIYVILSIGQRHAVICCSKEHSFFYQRYGFKPFGQSEPYDVFRTKKMALSLSLSLSSIPKYLHEKFEQMAAGFKKSGKMQRIIN